MPELFQIPAVFTIDATSFSRIRHWTLFFARPLFWIVALLTLAALALELGAYKREFKIAGPFAAETNPARHSLILAVPEEGRTPWWRQPLIGDTIEKRSESNLELYIDGHEIGPPHSLT